MKIGRSQDQVNDLMFEAIEVQNKNAAAAGGRGSKRGRRQQQSSTMIQEGGYSTESSGEEKYVERNTEYDDSSSSFLTSRCFWGMILFFVISGAIFGILFATGLLTNEDLEGVPILGDFDFEGFFDSDPFGGEVSPENPQDAYRWYSPQQTGLEITLLNALTDDWQTEFDQAVGEWDAGVPDTLTLSTRRVTVDPECEPLNGLIKVCNNNYGETDWRGLNTVLLDLDRRYIYSSTAKMNEFFLSGASAAQRQYTMCHEIGHAFGLPHWDEDFYNRNMGNCMDYTSRPRTNQQPSASNFEFLKQLYGEVGGGGNSSSSSSAVTQEAPVDSANNLPTLGWDNNNNNNNNNEEEENEEDEGDRRLRRGPSARTSGTTTTTTTTTIPEEVMAAYKAVVRGDSPLLSREHPSHRVLGEESSTSSNQHEHAGDGEASLIDLGYGGYGLLVFKLPPLPAPAAGGAGETQDDDDDDDQHYR